jgi:hypothetical protein
VASTCASSTVNGSGVDLVAEPQGLPHVERGVAVEVFVLDGVGQDR